MFKKIRFKSKNRRVVKINVMLKIYHMFNKSSFFVNIIVIDFCQISRVQILKPDILNISKRKFNGNLPELVIGNDMNFAVTIADTKKASLFANLSPGVKPIATTSPRFSECDRAFIRKTTDV